MIDLHIHSTASDGSFSPQEIVQQAQDQGIKAFALTDHDSIDGIKSVLEVIHTTSVEFISGVEISCTPPAEFKEAGSIHMLGYGFSIYDKGLNHLLDQAKGAREQRNPAIIEKLNELGFDISMAEVEERFGADQMGRPHIAELMVEKGYVESFRQAFDLYLGKDKPAYVDKFKVSCKEAIETILNAGGVPVLAHPGLLEFNRSRALEDFITILVGYGLQGIEVFYTDHSEKQVAYIKGIAREKKLLLTGGSDFHGTFNAGVKLGKGKDNIRVNYALFKALIDRLAAMRNLHARLDILEANLNYQFLDQSLLINALCHRSYLNEHQKSCSSDNERLEFLGDAVLGLCIGHMLMKKSPTKKEGELSKLRSNLVSEPALAEMARQIDLGRFVKLGKGEALSGGGDKNSILSDAFEAVMAAIYLDAGFDRTQVMIQDLFEAAVDKALSSCRTVDYKSSLQEYAQDIFNTTPTYAVAREIGPDHDKTFEISLTLAHITAKGFGKTKKAAEQDSARQALHILNPDKS
ncbi:MAG: ribonuclease III [Desulfobacterales bacterium]|nr:ribonuclease III [Desulfobacterales bacterium]